MNNEKVEMIKKLQQAEALYVIMSGFTKMPYVACGEETFDDKVFIYFEEAAAKEKGKELLEAGNFVRVAKVEKDLLMEFYASLYPIGVNCLHVNSGLEDEMLVQHNEVLRRRAPEETEGGKVRVENPELQLTALYFLQEFRKNTQAPMSDKIKETYDEMIVHFRRGKYIVPTQEDHGIPILKQQEGQAYIPLFTDLPEFWKFNREGKFKGGIVEAANISNLVNDEVNGVVINPFSINLTLNVSKKDDAQ